MPRSTFLASIALVAVSAVSLGACSSGGGAGDPADQTGNTEQDLSAMGVDGEQALDDAAPEPEEAPQPEAISPFASAGTTLSCGHVQWWNSYITHQAISSSGWHDTDLSVRSSSAVQLRHASRLVRHGVYGWGYMPEFVDTVTGRRFRFLHLRPQHQLATTVGRTYPAGYVVGYSGGDTRDTGYPRYSTGPHLCVQTLSSYRACFPAGHVACH